MTRRVCGHALQCFEIASEAILGPKQSRSSYRIVGNFREGFIFASQEPFAKIKTAKFLLPACKASEPRFNLATSNYLSVQTATEACQ